MLVQKQENEVYLNFINSIKSDITMKIYEYNLRLFMEFCGIDVYADLIGQKDKIIPYLMSLRQKKLSYNSISTRLNAIYHFYDMNDISLNKEKIKNSRFDRLSLIAKTQFVDQHLDRISNLELINKEMWSLYGKEPNNFKKVLILKEIAELQTYISPYYDASRYVMEKSIKDEQTKKSESIPS